MSELDTYGDRVIAFEAVKASDADRFPSTRQPLQLKANQTLSPPSKKTHTQIRNGMGILKPSPVTDNHAPRKNIVNDENKANEPDPCHRNMHNPESHFIDVKSSRAQSSSVSSYPPKPINQRVPHPTIANQGSSPSPCRSSPGAHGASPPPLRISKCALGDMSPVLEGARCWSPVWQHLMSPAQRPSIPAVLGQEDHGISTTGFQLFHERLHDKLDAPSHSEGKLLSRCDFSQ